MEVLCVQTGRTRYDIHAGPGGLSDLGGLLRGLEGGAAARYAVITDRNVWTLYEAPFRRAMDDAGLSYSVAVLPPGEGTKSPAGLAEVYAAFGDAGLTRGDTAVAFGGGVIGDLCGYAAATYMRGIRYVQVPTTLLAQVDSSVGGKTAIDLPQGKNLAGAFHQPAAVLIDTDLTATLPAREYRGGMAEVIKYGAIADAALFGRLEAGADGTAPETVLACCRIKAGIVGRDEFDHGERMLLNFGHTFGHAIELKGGFAVHTHGEAVAMGMALAARLGEAAGVTEPGVAARLERLLRLYGLDARCPYPPAELLPLVAADKKSTGDGARLILLTGIGDACIRPFGYEALADLTRRLADLEDAPDAPAGEGAGQDGTI